MAHSHGVCSVFAGKKLLSINDVLGMEEDSNISQFIID